VRAVGGDRYELDGELTVRGVTRPLTLHATFEGVATDPWGGERAAFSATGKLNREEFGLTWNQSLETGGVLLGKDVDIELEVEVVKQS
jgi:polyisoprenoid-binding protein YceI